MKITITIEDLQRLLNQQKSICRNRLWELFENSEFKDEINKLAENEKFHLGFHVVRDQLLGADYPEDFNVLKKYLDQ